MLSEWLKYDTEASWKKLASALTTIGENVVADNIRSQFMKISATASADGHTESGEQESDSDEIGKRCMHVKAQASC